MGLTSLDSKTVENYVRYWQTVLGQGDHRAMAAHYAPDATPIATELATVTGRPAIERFWQQACERAKGVGMTRTVTVDEIGCDGDLGYLRGRVVLSADNGAASTMVRRALRHHPGRPGGRALRRHRHVLEEDRRPDRTALRRPVRPVRHCAGQRRRVPLRQWPLGSDRRGWP